MKSRIYKGRRKLRYRKPQPVLLRSLERFHTIGLRLAGFLHQFKTPLHVIQSQTELLLDEKSLSPAHRQSLEMIHQNAVRLTAQTRDMMETARGGQGEMQNASVEKLLADICHSAEVDCRKKNITLEKDILITSPIRMDAIALEGALHNLVNNAIEAMPTGGMLKIKTFEATDLNHVGVEIQDNGAGMSRQDLARIRKPFQTSKKEGTGLGVYISRYILKRHHAAIRWQSKPGEGTKVTILFPKAPVTASSATKKISLWRRLLHAAAIVLVMFMPLMAAKYPQMLRLKGRFTDTKVPLTDTLPVRFSIWDTEDGYGNLLWEDVQNVTVQQDMFQVVLGRVKPLTPSVFSGGDRWVEIQIGNDAPMRPRHKIPNQELQAQVAAVQAAPVVAPPPAAPAISPELTDQERRDLELQIEKYKEPTKEPAKEPVKESVKETAHVAKHKHVIQASVDGSGNLGPVYEVQAGDTLKSIAQQLYGNAELWYDLYYLNRDRLGPMGYLFPGQLLVLPTQTPGEHIK